MNRFVRGVGVEAGRRRRWAPLLGALVTSCGAQLGDGAAVGGETHFLVTCGEDCGPGLSCIDGVCTRRCEPGFSSCSELATEATCVSAPEDSSERVPFGGTCDVVCVGDRDCAPLGTGYFCRSGACRAESEARPSQLSSTSFPLVRAVEADTCESGLRWVGGDRPSAEMRPGSDCVGCHREAGARPLLVGGTVYANGGPRVPQALDDCFGLEGIEVIVVDAIGTVFSTLTNRAGNFYFEGRESELVMPYSASINYNYFDGTEALAAMATVPSYGGCARCHGSSAERPPEFIVRPDPDYLNPVDVIFTPGLYP